MNKHEYLDSNSKKRTLRDVLFSSSDECESKIFAWVILKNHYHVLFEIGDGKSLGRLINLINGRSSRLINNIDNSPGRRVWYNYWDTCIRTENDFYCRLNYIHNNPIKHGYVDTFDDLPSYEFSSYPHYLGTNGLAWCIETFRRFPVIDHGVQFDDY